MFSVCGRRMPYELTFTRSLQIINREKYINECCVGGDIVVDQLLPSIRQHYGDVETNQEDWGWFIWFVNNGVQLAVDVFTDDADAGAFRVHLTSRKRRMLLFNRAVDTPELEELRELVVRALSDWVGGPIVVEAIERS